MNSERQKEISRYSLTLGHFCSDVNQGALSSLLPFLIAAHNFNYSTAASLVFFSNVISSIVQPLFGIAADKKNMPWMLTVSMLMAAGGMALTGFMDTYIGIVICVVVSGVGSAMFHPQATRLVNKLAKARHAGGAISIFSFGGSLGFTLGPIIVTAAITAIGLKGTGALCIPALLACGFMLARARDFSDEKLAEYERENLEAGKRTGWHNAPDQWRSFGLLALLIFGRSTMLISFGTFLPLFFINILGTTEAFGNGMLSFYYAMSTIMTLFGGMIADRYGYIRTIRISLVGLFATAVVFSLSRSVAISVIALIPLGCMLNLSYSPMVVLGQRYLPNHVGLASGLTLGLAMSLGGLMAPVFGHIGDTYGLETVMYVIAAVGAFPTVISFFLKTPLQDRDNKQDGEQRKK